MFSRGHAVLWELQPLLWLLTGPPIHLMRSGNQCYLVTVDLLNHWLTFRPSTFPRELITTATINKRTSFLKFLWCIFAVPTKMTPQFTHTESVGVLFCMETWNRKTLLFRHICIVFLALLMNFAEPPQFTASLILPPSAIPMKPIIAHLFILSTVSLKIIFVRRLAKSERIIRDFKHMINSFLVVLSNRRWQFSR